MEPFKVAPAAARDLGKARVLLLAPEKPLDLAGFQAHFVGQDGDGVRAGKP